LLLRRACRTTHGRICAQRVAVCRVETINRGALFALQPVELQADLFRRSRLFGSRIIPHCEHERAVCCTCSATKTESESTRILWLPSMCSSRNALNEGFGTPPSATNPNPP